MGGDGIVSMSSLCTKQKEVLKMEWSRFTKKGSGLGLLLFT